MKRVQNKNRQYRDEATIIAEVQETLPLCDIYKKKMRLRLEKKSGRRYSFKTRDFSIEDLKKLFFIEQTLTGVINKQH